MDVLKYKSEMKYALILLLILSCSLNKPKPFKPFIPAGYEPLIRQGMDSYIGTVQKDQISFSYDYGMYSEIGPLSKIDFKNFVTNEYGMKSLKSSCDIGKFDDNKIRKAIKVDSLFQSTSNLENSKTKVIIRLSLEDVICDYETSSFRSKDVEEFYHYQFIEKEDKGVISKIFYPKVDSLNYAGIYLMRRNDMNRLSYSTRNYSKKYHDEILEILLEVEKSYKRNR